MEIANSPFAKVTNEEEAIKAIKEYQTQLTAALPKEYMFNPDSSSYFSEGFAPKLGDFIDDVNSQLAPSWSVKIRQGLREPEEQQGHIHSGASTTPVSSHFFGEGVDLVYLQNGKPVRLPKDPKLAPYEVQKALRTVELMADKHNLKWGGDWKDPYDPWHIQHYENSVEMLQNRPELVPLYNAYLPRFQEMMKNPRYAYQKELVDYLLSLQNRQQQQPEQIAELP